MKGKNRPRKPLEQNGTGNPVALDVDSPVSVPGMAQSLRPSKPAKPMPRRSQKRPKLLRHSELFAMSAGRPAPPPARTIRQPRRKLVETDRVWVSRNPDSPLPGFGIPVLPPRRILASLVAYGNGPRSVGFFAFPFALDDDGTGLPLYPLDGFLARPPRPYPLCPCPWLLGGGLPASVSPFWWVPADDRK